MLAQFPGGGGGGATGGAGGPGGNPGGGETSPGSSSGDSAGESAPPPPLRGPININTAPFEVLMTFDGMTEEAADAIVTQRESQPFQSRGDLLQLQEITNEVFNSMIEKTTVISDSFTARVMGMARTQPESGGRPREIGVHLTVMLDRTSGRCRIVRLRQDN